MNKIICDIPECNEFTRSELYPSAVRLAESMENEGAKDAIALLEKCGFKVAGGMILCPQHKGRYIQIQE